MPLKEVTPVERSIVRLKKLRDDLNLEIAALAAMLPGREGGRRKVVIINPLAHLKGKK